MKEGKKVSTQAAKPSKKRDEQPYLCKNLPSAGSSLLVSALSVLAPLAPTWLAPNGMIAFVCVDTQCDEITIGREQTIRLSVHS